MLRHYLIPGKMRLTSIDCKAATAQEDVDKFVQRRAAALAGVRPVEDEGRVTFLDETTKVEKEDW